MQAQEVEIVGGDAVAELLGIPRRKVYELKLPEGVIVKIGRLSFYDKRALIAWIKSGGNVRKPAATMRLQHQKS